MALISWLLISKPATPGLDFVGRVVQPAKSEKKGVPALKEGDVVFGAAGTGPFAGGALREYALVESGNAVRVPEGVELRDAAASPVAALTAYQTIVPRVRKGDKVFLNGGSGGVGMYGIQIAKLLGCYVVTSCSTANVELCKGLGADEVVDYRKGDVADQLKKSGVRFDHVVDNVGKETKLYYKAHEYTRPGAVFINIAGEPSLRYLWNSTMMKVWPGFLGGGKRKIEGFLTEPKTDQLVQLAAWLKEGKVKSLIDSTFPFEEAPRAFEKLKTGRAKGKIIINVASEASK